MTITGETLFFGAIMAIVAMAWINNAIRRAHWRRMMQQQQMGMGGMGFGFGMPGGFGGGMLYRSRSTGGLIIVLLMVFAAIVMMVQFKEGYKNQETDREGKPVRDPTTEVQSNTTSLPPTSDSLGASEQDMQPQEQYPNNPFNAKPRNRQNVELFDNDPSPYDEAELVYEEEATPEPATNSATEEPALALGYGKQLIALSEQQDALLKARNLQHQLQDTYVFVAVDTRNGVTRYKIIAGNYPDRSTAKNALPELDGSYPGNYPVDLNELTLVYHHGVR
ncbi:MAG: SPOR domain-containing protein [Saprospiraceae bacterium]|nr:SPOR domain-containing protein [Lewinella sp.]